LNKSCHGDRRSAGLLVTGLLVHCELAL
jgi:hypothetical protein